MASSLFADINYSLREKTARSGRVHDKYRAVFVRWDSNGDQAQGHGGHSDAKDLASLLERSYGFKTKEVTIPLQDSLDTLKSRLRAAIDTESSPLCLWLIYYTGGATVERGRLLWTRPSRVDSEDVIPDKLCLDVFAVLGAIATVTFDAVLMADCDHGIVPSIPYNLLNELRDESAEASTDTSVSTGRVFEALFAPSGLPKGAPSFTTHLCRALEDLKDTRVNIMGLRSKLVSVSKNGESYAPYYTKLMPSGQSNLLEKVGTTAELRVALRQHLDSKVLGELKEWAQRKPAQIKRLSFAECEKGFAWVASEKQTPPLSEFTLSVSTTNPELLDDADWHTWIGSLPSSVDTPRYNVYSAFNSRRLSKSAGDELDAQLEALVRRRNHEESWRNQDARFGHYARVVVLPLIWEITGFDPALHVVEDLELLVKTFKDDFGFAVEEIFKIPAGKAIRGHDALEEKIKDLVDQGRGPNVLGAGDLLIVIYSGHGNNTVHSSGRAIWSSGALPNSGYPVQRETVDWTQIERNLDTAECDVAQILDCCHAATAAKAPDDRGRNEILAACVRENRTVAGPYCFSRTVTSALKRLAGEGKPFSFQDLYERVELDTRKINRSGITTTIPSPFYKQISHHMSSIMLRPRSADAFGGAQRPMSVPDAMDRKVVAKVFVVVSLNSRLEEVRTEHITKNELLDRLKGGRL
ncbi:hypothetical protein QBC34DRAFT_187743 [Podospora aff. communis PSN243]|uniref:Caspase domain-containing protein n=1 Tax=Podospora aff. communis PSN243 TaxID=3040156 RepID=A0AAV9G6L7_9PEZI|nr:hypothetical protein QBC34DRAFT_187743 [Podospora aff. communis PSN243]